MAERGRRKHRPNGVEKALLLCALALLLVLTVLAIRLCRLLTPRPSAEPVPTAQPSDALAAPEDRLPSYLSLGERPPEAGFEDEEGREVPLSALLERGENGLWLVFWASWCPDCAEQLELAAQMEQLAADYGVDLALVDRLEPSRETKEAVQEKLRAAGCEALCIFDRDARCYAAWGFHEIPSAVVLDRDGIVRCVYAGTMSAGECEGMLRILRDGRGSVTLSYIEDKLSDGAGGVYTGTKRQASSPSGQDILSESEGLMLCCALEREDRALFDRTWRCIEERLLLGGLSAWYVTERGEKAPANATLDDLRIWYALHQAAQRWNGAYAQQAEVLLSAIGSLCLDSRGELLDFVELASGKKAQTISLCYLDLEILDAMAACDPRFVPTGTRAREILEGGFISQDFPLYYGSYGYSKRAYDKADLNTAEALYTLWDLSRAGLLREESLSWLRERVADGDLAARYDVEGHAVPGYTYHSTAVYALAALIGEQESDAALYQMALRRMSRLFMLDAEDARFGAYCQAGAELSAFDQLLPLMVDCGMERKR